MNRRATSTSVGDAVCRSVLSSVQKVKRSNVTSHGALILGKAVVPTLADATRPLTHLTTSMIPSLNSIQVSLKLTYITVV